MRKNGFLLSVSSILACSATSAGAQTAQTSAIEEPMEGTTIIVTARNRQEDIMEVPIAITAFGEEDIEKRQIRNLTDVAALTPGFNYEDFAGGLGLPVIRGTTQQVPSVPEQNVSVFYDGIYIPRPFAFDLSFKNLSRIEVLKGPQSARYGRNSFMGAINYVPRRPGNEIAADLSVTVGVYDLYEGAAYVSVPIVGDLLSVAAAYSYSSFDGAWASENPFRDTDIDPGTRDRMGGWDKESYGFDVRLSPASSVVIDASYRHFDENSEAVPSEAVTTLGTTQGGGNDGNCGGVLGGKLRGICGRIPGISVFGIDPRSYGPQTQADIYRIAGEMELADNLSASYSFGRIEAGTFAVQEFEADPINGGALAPGILTQNSPIQEFEYSQHELRANYEAPGGVRFGVAGLYSRAEDTQLFTFGVMPRLTSTPTVSVDPRTPDGFFIFATLTDRLTRNDTFSVGGEVLVPLLDDRLRLGLEARITREEKSERNNVSGLLLDDVFTSTTPKAVVEFDLDPDSLLYASVARGIKSGGFNGAATLPRNRTYDPEENWSYEIGYKGRLFDGLVTLTAAAYYIDWTSIQIPSADEGNLAQIIPIITLNLGGATVYGFEVGAAARPTDWLSLDGSFSFSNPEFNEGTIDQSFVASPFCDDIVCPRDGEISGNRLQRTSRYQATLGAEVSGDVSERSGVGFYVRGDLRYQSEQFAESINVSTIPPRTLVNASAGLNFGRFEAMAWVNNVFDTRKLAGTTFVTSTLSTSHLLYETQPRTAGVTISFEY